MKWLHAEIVAPKHDKYLYVVSGGIVGGIMFGYTGSWSLAIAWDALAVAACWAAIRGADLASDLLSGSISHLRTLFSISLHGKSQIRPPSDPRNLG